MSGLDVVLGPGVGSLKLLDPRAVESATAAQPAADEPKVDNQLDHSGSPVSYLFHLSHFTPATNPATRTTRFNSISLQLNHPSPTVMSTAPALSPASYTLTSRKPLNDGNAIPAFGLGVYVTEPGAETYNAVKWALEVGTHQGRVGTEPMQALGR